MFTQEAISGSILVIVILLIAFFMWWDFFWGGVGATVGWLGAEWVERTWKAA